MIEHVNEALHLLSTIRDGGGSVFPTWNVTAEHGFEYRVDSRLLDEAALEALARSDHLERIYVDRVSRCPECKTHLLNMREVCIACGSPRISSVELLHHFRCGYVSPSYEFPVDKDGRRCPKCHGALRNRGTDHDVPGPHFICESCSRSFQMPEIGAFCLSCGTHFRGNDLDRIIYEDVYGYKLTPFGVSALRLGRLDPAGGDSINEYDLPLMRKSIFMAFLEDERKRRQRFGTPFSLLLLTVAPPESDAATRASEPELLENVVAFLSETDKLARFDDHHYLLLLPSTDPKKGANLAKRISTAETPVLQEWALSAQAIDVPEGGPAIDRVASSLASAVVHG